MTQVRTRELSDNYTHRVLETTCTHPSGCTDIFNCPFDECPTDNTRNERHDLRAPQAANLLEQGLKPAAIAEQLGVSLRTAYRYLGLTK